MPFWAIYMLACVALILLGWRGKNWFAPAIIFAGLLGARAASPLPEVYNEIASCSGWIAATSLLYMAKKHLASLLIGISAAVYLPLIVVGYRIETLGLLPIVSDPFLILAIGASGADILGKRSNRDRDNDRRLPVFSSSKEGVAMRHKGNNPAAQGEA